MSAEIAQRHPRLAELFGIDLRTLALFRVALGAVLFVTLCTGFPDLAAFWTDWGVMPRHWMLQADAQHRFSLYLLDGSSPFTAMLLAAQCLCALLLMLGWHTRAVTIIGFVLYGSLLNRNLMLLIGGDLLMACLLFWSMFLPLGARYSVDAALATNAPPKDPRHLSWASAALLVQVMSVYFFSAILKHSPHWVPDYTAVYYALSLDRYATPLGQWLLNFPPLLALLTGFVWWLELLGPLLIFTPWFNRPVRLFVMLAFMTMHVGFLLCLELGHFPYVSLCSLTVFAGGWLWDAAARRHQQRHPGPLRIYYDRDCGFCVKTCLLFREFLALPRAEIAPAQDTPRAKTLLEANYSWVVIDADEQAYLKWPAFVLLVRRSPLFGWLWPLLRQPRLTAPGNRAYDFVGRQRGVFGQISARLLPLRAIRWEITPGWQRVAAVAMLAVFVGNVALLEPSLKHWFKDYDGRYRAAGERVMRELAAPMRLLRIDQYWNMFAPHPLIGDGWMVIPARLADGSEVDLLRAEHAPDYAKPRHYSQTHENIRWHTYRGRLAEPEFKAHLPYFARYLCRNWNAPRFDDAEARKRRLMTFKIIYVLEPTPKPGDSGKTEQNVIWRHECFPDETKGQIP